MTDWQIDSLLLGVHNIARALGGIASALGVIAFALFIYPWLGGFASGKRREVTIEEPVHVQVKARPPVDATP